MRIRGSLGISAKESVTLMIEVQGIDVAVILEGVNKLDMCLQGK